MSNNVVFAPKDLHEFLQPYLPYLEIKNEDKTVHLEKWDSDLHRFDVHIIVEEGRNGFGLSVWFNGNCGMQRAESLEDIRPLLDGVTQPNLNEFRRLLGLKAQE